MYSHLLRMTRPYAFSNAPYTAGATISVGEGGFFGGGCNERVGDYCITTGSSNQRILIGSVPGQSPVLVVGSNAVSVQGSMAVQGSLAVTTLVTGQVESSQMTVSSITLVGGGVVSVGGTT